MHAALFAALAISSLAAEPAVSTAAPAAPSYEARQKETLQALRSWFLDDEGKAAEPVIKFSAAEEKEHADELASLRALADQVRFLRKGRVEASDDWQSYQNLAVVVARRLAVEPPERAIPVYRGRVRAKDDAPSKEEKAVRDELATQDKAPGVAKRYLFIADLIGSPEPKFEVPQRRVVVVKNKKGKKIKKVIEPPELAPPPKPESVIAKIDWAKADELAEVADDNARGWDRKPKESLKRYRRRLRRLRAHCYEWVRHDLEALGIWDANLFRGYVPPTRRDRQRPIRAASFALAMAKIAASEKLAAKTALRELNPRVDPLVRGAILVFAPKACDYSSRNGHIEIITSVEPLQAASYKFHPVKTECLVKAANENKMHVYVPLVAAAPEAVGGR